MTTVRGLTNLPAAEIGVQPSGTKIHADGTIVPTDGECKHGLDNAYDGQWGYHPLLIVRHWDDLLRVAGSLKMGAISASELTRSLLRSNRPSTLARAIGELGRVAKTLYLLSYLDDETYRRRILTQLNRGEGRHSVARTVFHGQRGEVRQRYREGQEDQLGALGLVVNVLVLWNTLYMDAALAHLRRTGAEVKPEDVARLSPLGHEHINVLGRYSFALAEGIAQGELRPLRHPDDGDDLTVGAA